MLGFTGNYWLKDPNNTVENIFGNQTVFWVPNVVLAYWGGEGGTLGRFWVNWRADLRAMYAKGYAITLAGYGVKTTITLSPPVITDNMTSTQIVKATVNWWIKYSQAIAESGKKYGWVDDPWTANQFTDFVKAGTATKTLLGTYVWAHGGPDGILLNSHANGKASFDTYFATYGAWGKAEQYNLGLGILFACSSDSAKNLFSANGIFWGSKGLLIPPLCGPTIEAILRKFPALRFGKVTARPPEILTILKANGAIQ